MPYAKWVISYEHRGDGQSLGRLGNLAAHPGVNASDLFAYSALVMAISASHDEADMAITAADLVNDRVLPS